MCYCTQVLLLRKGFGVLNEWIEMGGLNLNGRNAYDILFRYQNFSWGDV